MEKISKRKVQQSLEFSIHEGTEPEQPELKKVPVAWAFEQNIFEPLNVSHCRLKEKKTVGRFLNALNKQKENLKKLDEIPNEIRLMAQAQRQTVFPSEIKRYLEESLTDLRDTEDMPANLDEVSKILAREILKFVANPNTLTGHGKRLFENERKYAFPIFDKQNKYIGKEVISLPFGLWIKKTDTGIELELIGQQLGEGSFKKVFLSKPIAVSLLSPLHPSSIKDSVVVLAQKDKAIHVLEGQKVVRKYFLNEELNDPQLRLAGLLTATDRMHKGILEARDVEYRGDLERLSGELQVDDKLQVLTDNAFTLKIIHTKGLVHNDIKPANILVGKGANPRGFIGDFDFLGKAGSKANKGTLLYVDNIMFQHQIRTPLMDIYAFAKTSAETLFGVDNDTGIDEVDDIGTKYSAKVYEKALKKKSAQMLSRFAQDRLDALDISININCVEELDKISKKELSEEQINGLTDIKNKIKKLIEIRDGIIKVLKENPSTAKFLENNPQIKKQIKERNPEGMESLFLQFPGFRDFLTLFDKSL